MRARACWAWISPISTRRHAADWIAARPATVAIRLCGDPQRGSSGASGAATGPDTDLSEADVARCSIPASWRIAARAIGLPAPRVATGSDVTAPAAGAPLPPGERDHHRRLALRMAAGTDRPLPPGAALPLRPAVRLRARHPGHGRRRALRAGASHTAGVPGARLAAPGNAGRRHRPHRAAPPAPACASARSLEFLAGVRPPRAGLDAACRAGMAVPPGNGSAPPGSAATCWTAPPILPLLLRERLCPSAHRRILHRISRTAVGICRKTVRDAQDGGEAAVTATVP